MSGTTHDPEFVNEFRQKTRFLAVYATLVATETDDTIVKVKHELKKFEIIFYHLDEMEKDMKKGFSEIDKIGKILIHISKLSHHI